MLQLIEFDLLRLAFAIIGSAVISLLAYKFKALSISGAISAFVMGVSFVFFGEPVWFMLLLTFFVSSTFWSKYKKYTSQKRNAEALYEKSGKRDAWQVFANGGIGMLLCIVSYYIEQQSVLPLFVMVIAIVNADTWATEIGGLSKTKPRHIVTGKVVEAGTSGGITVLGTLAALGGSATIGIVALLCTGKWSLLFIAICAGVVGCMIDSLLGATVQRMYRCTTCNKLTERALHCNQPTQFYSGLRWVNNDIVNISSSIIGSSIVWIFYIAFV